MKNFVAVMLQTEIRYKKHFKSKIGAGSPTKTSLQQEIVGKGGFAHTLQCFVSLKVKLSHACNVVCCIFCRFLFTLKVYDC